MTRRSKGRRKTTQKKSAGASVCVAIDPDPEVQEDPEEAEEAYVNDQPDTSLTQEEEEAE